MDYINKWKIIQFLVSQKIVYEFNTNVKYQFLYKYMLMNIWI